MFSSTAHASPSFKTRYYACLSQVLWNLFPSSMNSWRSSLIFQRLLWLVPYILYHQIHRLILFKVFYFYLDRIISLAVNIDILLCNWFCNEIFQVFALCQKQHFSMKESGETISISCTLNLPRHSSLQSPSVILPQIFIQLTFLAKPAHVTDFFSGTKKYACTYFL